MKFAISNIAWKYQEREKIYSVMQEYGFNGLEIAPGLFLNSANPYFESKESYINAKKEIEKHNFNLVSMQALLFGSKELFLFQDELSRQKLLNYCRKAIDFASFLKIPNLVFGSPKNRIIPKDMTQEIADKIAIDFFKEQGNYAYDHNTCLSMEANASAYGGNFITKTAQAIELVKKVDSNGFKLNLDFGTMSLENDSIDIIEQALPYTNHIHISEGFLAPIYEGNKNVHIERVKCIKNSEYKKYLSIEMKAISENDNIDHIKKSLEFVNEIYR